MRILYISTRIDGSGGLQRSLSVRLNYLAKMGYEIYLLTTNSENRALYFPLDKKINYIERQHVSGFFDYRKLIQSTYKEVNPDLVIVSDNGLKGFLIPYFISNKTKIIYELHVTKEQLVTDNNKFFGTLGISKILITKSSKKFSAFVVLSKKEAEKWNLKNLSIIPNPITLPNSKISSLENKKAIFVGRLKLVKGVDFLVQVWEKVNQKYPDWTLEVYGEKFPEFDMEKAINDKGLNHSAFVFKPVYDIQNKYSQASIFLMTSRIEPFGLVLTEAMSCGLPCVSFDAPEGPSSIIEDNQNGFLISCFDVESFSKKVIELIENVNLRKKIGVSAKKSSLKYNQEKIMEQWIMLYEKVIK
jgi:glycosyltransferase involved in cell wall biosynthesis